MKNLLVFLVFTASTFLINCGENADSHAIALNAEQISTVMARHNFYRNEVGVDDLEWSDELAASAQKWANQLGKNCAFKHSSSEYGENIWMGTSGAFTTADVVDSWGSEKEDYTYSDNSCSDVCGHYTQIVWSTTQYVGCGVVSCDGFDIWVCQYDPAGNVTGQKPY
jgi:pathogenesis-related protein 1